MRSRSLPGSQAEGYRLAGGSRCSWECGIVVKPKGRLSRLRNCEIKAL